MNSARLGSIETTLLDAQLAATGATSEQAFCYTPRKVRARPVIFVNGYRLKPYEIYLSEQEQFRLSDEQLLSMASQCLPASDDPLEHGIGFLMAHFARDGNYLLVSRWYGGNMLKHDLFEFTQGADGWQISSLRSTGIVACVWELQVISFERQAWVCTAMAKGGTESSFAMYLNTALEGWI